ncbi:MAG: hypothetical protein K2P45_06325 [Eubacterium sp.]|nr:hypothetical protein [Eubacterium sp.]
MREENIIIRIGTSPMTPAEVLVDWEYEMPFGLLHSKTPDEKVDNFLGSAKFQDEYTFSRAFARDFSKKAETINSEYIEKAQYIQDGRLSRNKRKPEEDRWIRYREHEIFESFVEC